MLSISAQKLFFAIIVYLSILHNLAFANDNLIISSSPSEIYRGDTTKIFSELVSPYNLSYIEIRFLVDGAEKGVKYSTQIEKNKIKSFTFDCLFDDKSYLGEHYIEFRVNSSTDNGSIIYKNFYEIKELKEKNWMTILSEHLATILANIVFMIILLAMYLHYRRKSIIKLTPENRRTIFSLIITILPIATSFFSLSIDRIPLRMNAFLIIACFVFSYFITIYSFMKYEIDESDDNVPANNFTVYSIYFLLLGLLNILIFIIALNPLQ